MLTRESPAALVRKDGKLIGIVSRYDVLQQLIGTADVSNVSVSEPCA